MELEISKDLEELSERATAWIIARINMVLENKDRFTIALSGGNTPKKIYRSLAKSKLDWKKIHIFWGDERFVPLTDDRNNAKMAFDEWLNHVPIPKNQIHIIPTDKEPDVAAIEYERVLRHYFPSEKSTFDLVLLGLGDNAHTLSLFPGYDQWKENEKWVVSVYVKELSMYRITLTAPVVNAAKCVAFLVSGADKSIAIKHVLESEFDPETYPAQVIRPENDELFWLTDEAAAADLE